MVTHHPHPAHTAPPAAAVEPHDPTRIDWPLRQAFALLPFEVVDGLPVNPREPHREPGRGGLHLWGENLTADGFVTALDDDGARWLLMIERGDGRGWALPGGFVNADEIPHSAAIREVQEESGLRLDPSRCWAHPARYVPDDRNSGQAWIVTTPVETQLYLADGWLPPVTGNSDATRAAWLPADTYPQLEQALATRYDGRIFDAHSDMLRDLLHTTPPTLIPTSTPASPPDLPQPATDTITAIDLLRDEIKTLKDEQRDRIKHRDSLIYSVIVAVAAVVGGTRLAGAAVPLLLPPVTLLLGWTYLINDQMVSAIGRHLRTQLAPRLAALAGTEVLLWESTRLLDRRYRQRKSIQLAVDLLAFVGSALAAVGWYWAHGPANPFLWVVSIIEAVAALIVGWQIASYAERRLTPDTRPAGTDGEASR